jgi:hypothetical protein
VSNSTVVTSAEGFAAGSRRCAREGLRAAVEANGITPWICQLLKDLGVKVVVVNPNRAQLIAESRRKSDRADAQTLAELLRLGGLPEGHQPSLQTRRSAADVVCAPGSWPWWEDVEFGVLSLAGWNAARTAATRTGSRLTRNHSGNRGDRQEPTGKIKGMNAARIYVHGARHRWEIGRVRWSDKTGHLVSPDGRMADSLEFSRKA